MKTLFLTRHAKSSWKHPGLSDHDRPLNRRGEADAPRMAAFLAANYPTPTLLVSSTAVRALTTAEMLAQGFGYPATEVRRLPQLYLADVPTLLTVARELPDETDVALLVAHNPGMTDCLNALAGAGIDNLPTCGVARIAFDAAHWAELQPAQGRLLSLDVPKALNAGD